MATDYSVARDRLKVGLRLKIAPRTIAEPVRKTSPPVAGSGASDGTSAKLPCKAPPFDRKLGWVASCTEVGESSDGAAQIPEVEPGSLVMPVTIAAGVKAMLEKVKMRSGENALVTMCNPTTSAIRGSRTGCKSAPTSNCTPPTTMDVETRY